jgi:hypothetical protein
VTYKRSRDLPTIRKMSDDLWDEIKIMLQSEKTDKTIEEVPTTYHQKNIRQYSLPPKNWMSMENASKGAWFRLYIS